MNQRVLSEQDRLSVVGLREELNVAHTSGKRVQIEQELVVYMPALQKFARRVHTLASDIDDLVQETVMKALANLDKFELGSQLKSWLFTISAQHLLHEVRLIKA